MFGVLGFLFYGDSVHSVITDNLGSGAISDSVRISLSISLVFTYAIQMFPVTEFADQMWKKKVFEPQQHQQPSISDEINNKQQLIVATCLGEQNSEKYQSLKDGENNEKNNIKSQVQVLMSPSALSNSDDSVTSSSSSSSTSAVPLIPLRYRELCLISTRILLVGFTALISIVFPNFGLIVSLVGSFSNSAIAFILPQLFYLKLVVFSCSEIDHRRVYCSIHGSTWLNRNRCLILPLTIIILGIMASCVGVYTTIEVMINGSSN